METGQEVNKYATLKIEMKCSLILFS